MLEFIAIVLVLILIALVWGGRAVKSIFGIIFGAVAFIILLAVVVAIVQKIQTTDAVPQTKVNNLELSDVYASPFCKALVLLDVSAIESPSSILKKDEINDGITVYTVNTKTGIDAFCSHGGYCYPAHVMIGSKKQVSMKLLNCVVNYESKSSLFDGEISYNVELNREKVSEKALRYNDLRKKLSDFGLCSACADNAATLYIEQPKSQCAKLVQKFIEGNIEAQKELNQFPDYCEITQ